MKNYQIHNYKNFPICDAHIHLHVEGCLDEMVEIYKNIKEHFNYEKMSLLCLPTPHYALSDNYKAFYYKDMIEGIYANSGILHTFKFDEDSDYYLSEIKKYHKMGADGIKMIEGKPDDRKMLGKPLNHKDFDKFYQYAEEHQIPILMHWGDPREFWDMEKIPQWALDRGWFYDETYPSFAKFRGEVEGILSKFPNLKITFAHFFFTSDDFDYAEEFLTRWKNVSFDLTPGTEMYKNFNAAPEKWRKFFVNHSDKILYGTDIYNWKPEGKTVEERYSHAVNLERSFLEKSESFLDPWMGVQVDNPFNLENDILTKIYNTNFKRIWGETPRPLDADLIVYHCKDFLNNNDLNQVDIQNMRQIICHFSR